MKVGPPGDPAQRQIEEGGRQPLIRDRIAVLDGLVCAEGTPRVDLTIADVFSSHG